MAGDVSPTSRWPGSESEDILAPRLAVGVVLVALTGIFASGVLHLVSMSALTSTPELVLGSLAMAGMLATQLTISARLSSGRRGALGHWLLLAQVALTYLPFPLLGQAWVGVPGFLAGSLLLTLSGARSWVLFALVVGTTAGMSAATGLSAVGVAYFSVSTAMTGMIVFGLARMSDMVVKVRAAQAEIARLAVEQERLRFARDLHDLLGYSLSAITLRCELTYRLVDPGAIRAREEIAAVLDISRQALADVREVARAYRDMSLTTETASARSVLEAAGVEVSVDLRYERLPDRVNTVLATVLREGVTNILRHSKVRRCEITARVERDTAELVVVNDGVPEPGPVEGIATSGSGLGNLAARLEAVNGRLTVGVREDGRFHLVAGVPLRLGHPEAVPLDREPAA